MTRSISESWMVARLSVMITESIKRAEPFALSLPEPLLRRLAQELLQVEGMCAVLCDLTHKPPATIEWE